VAGRQGRAGAGALVALGAASDIGGREGVGHGEESIGLQKYWKYIL
jgi:hypothetical protein